MNVGDFLTGSNPFMGTTDYLGAAASAITCRREARARTPQFQHFSNRR